MNLKEFLKPEKRKFILPTILIIMFFIAVYFFYYASSFMEATIFNCENLALIQEYNTAIEKNDTVSANLTFEKIKTRTEMLAPKVNETLKIQQYAEFFVPAFLFIGKIDLLFPWSCEFFSYQYGNICRFYISEENFNCFTNFLTNQQNLTQGLVFFTFGEPKIPSYVPLSALDIFLNVFILFVDGYLISCLIVFGYDKFRGRRK